MKQFIAGFSIGALLLAGTTVFAAEPVKQFVVSLASYPIVVNGKEFKDAPILNYEGSTYVPLAKLGDIAGVNYIWNEEAKRVEISTMDKGVSVVTEDISNLPNDDMDYIKTKALQLEAEKKWFEEMNKKNADAAATEKNTKESTVPQKKGLVVEDGKTVLYAFDKFDDFVGVFSDESDKKLSEYKNKGLNPPKLSEGWINLPLLGEIYKFMGFETETMSIVIKTPTAELARFSVPEDLIIKGNGDTESNGVKIKLFEYSTYLNIADLQKIGLLQKAP